MRDATEQGSEIRRIVARGILLLIVLGAVGLLISDWRAASRHREAPLLRP